MGLQRQRYGMRRAKRGYISRVLARAADHEHVSVVRAFHYRHQAIEPRFREFAVENRPEGWNVWLTLALSPKAADATVPRVDRPILGR